MDTESIYLHFLKQPLKQEKKILSFLSLGPMLSEIFGSLNWHQLNFFVLCVCVTRLPYQNLTSLNGQFLGTYVFFKDLGKPEDFHLLRPIREIIFSKE